MISFNLERAFNEWFTAWKAKYGDLAFSKTTLELAFHAGFSLHSQTQKKRWIVLLDFNSEGSSESWNTNYMEFYSAASEEEADFVGAYELARLLNEDFDHFNDVDDGFNYGSYEIREEGEEAD